jgi:hypothetical protein
MPISQRVFRYGLAIFLMAAAAPLATAGPLPRLAISLSPGVALAEAVRATQGCGSQDPVFVLAPVNARIGSAEGLGLTNDDAISQSLPAGSARFFANLRLEIEAPAATGRERESLIDREATELVERLALDRAELAGIVVEPVASEQAADILPFTLATLLVKMKGARPSLQLAVAVPINTKSTGQAGALADAARIVAYADSVVFPASALGGSVPLDALSAGKPVLVQAADAASGPAAALLDLIMLPGASAANTAWLRVPDLNSLGALCTTSQFLSKTVGEEFEMTAPERAPLAVLSDGRPASPAVAFVGSRSADAVFLVKPGGSRDAPRTLALAAAPAKAPLVTCFDPIGGRPLEVRAPAGQAANCRADSEYAVFHARAAASDDRLFEAVNVTARSSMRVEEVIARWQTSRETERRFLDNYTVPVFTTLHFESASLETGFDISLELRQFVDRAGTQDWVQTGLLVEGVRLGRGQEFPLPSLEPDKIVTKPLEIRIDDRYAYELEGTEPIDGHVCYVVDIKPSKAAAAETSRSGVAGPANGHSTAPETAESLYSGKLWIDGTTFRQVRLHLEQRDGRNNVASHVETQEFEQVKDAQAHEFTLVRSTYAQDIVNLAGRSVVLEKRFRFGDYEINTTGFAASLDAARSSDDPMFRDTEQGLRSLRKKGQERVVDTDVGKRIFASLAGVLYDGAYGFPVPLAGVSWVDFDFKHTNTQLSAFFAGPIFVANLSRQQSKVFRWGLDLSLIALPNMYFDYTADNAEITKQQVRNFEQYAGGLLAWQINPNFSLETQADVYYEIYQATRETDAKYRIPKSSPTLDLYGEAKYVLKEFSAVGTVDEGIRFGWTDFGYADAPPPTSSTYQKYSLELSQHVFVGKLTRGGVSASYFGGHNLDRFSQYSPSFLEPPTMKGIPAGVDSFDSVTTVTAYYGFNAMDLAKLEGSYGHSWTRNRFEGSNVRQFDGLDLRLGTAGPFGTFVQGSISYALRGNLERYSTRWGTYLVFLKPMRK